MLSSCGKDEGYLASIIFHHKEWDENFLPCDTFDDEDDIDIELDPDFF